MAVNGLFFWLAGVGGDGRRRAGNNGGGDVQGTTPGTSGSDFMVSGVVGGGREDKNLSPTSLNTIPVYEITKAATKPAKSLNNLVVINPFFSTRFLPAAPANTKH